MAPKQSTQTTSGVQPPPTPPTQQPTKPQKTGARRWLPAIIAGVVLLLVIVGGIIAYFVYQSPNKVLTDGITNAMSVKTATVSGSINIKASQFDATMTIDGGSNNDRETTTKVTLDIAPKQAGFGSQSIKLDGEVITAKDGALYLKVSKLKETVDKFIDPLAEQYSSRMPSISPETFKREIQRQLDPTIRELDGQWIKFSADDLNNESGKEFKCMQEALTLLGTDKNAQNELKKAYKDNPSIAIQRELGLENGSYGFEVKADKAKAESLAAAVRDTTFGKKIASCSDDSSSSTNTDKDTSDDTIKIWVSQWGHQITRLQYEGTSDRGVDGTIDIKFDMGKTAPVDVPNNARSIKEIEDAIKGLTNSIAS